MAHYPYQITSIEQYHEMYRKSVDDPEGFWSEIAENFSWHKKWDTVLTWNFTEPSVRWFEGAKLNITENCLDRHIAELGDKPAVIWEPDNPDEPNRILTYSELLDQVKRVALVLKNNGVKKGDRVCIYMGMIPELTIALLACARIGAVHSVVFAGFSSQSITDRLTDAGAEFIITCDGSFRGGKEIDLKGKIDDALINCPFVKRVIVHQRTGSAVSMTAGRDVWLGEELGKLPPHADCPAEVMDAEDMLFILYTSGSTGKPKGVVHTTAGYMVWASYTFVNVFQYKPGQVYFCTADIGWITGHSYIVYGPLSAGATTVLFEGVPTCPDAGRLWEITEKYKVDILYTAPTAIRSLMAAGTSFAEGKDLSSLKVLGTVGEPINEEAWHWFYKNIGKERCPVVDTWWQTETGGIMISNLAGVTPHKPAHATLPLPGVQPLLVDEHGNELTGNGVSGNLCIRAPWPGMLRTTYGDHERCRTNYFAAYPNLYFTGDGCLRDEMGNYRITGRVDDVLNISGHRIGTAELENAINMHSGVVESAVVGYPHDIKGQGIHAYVIFEVEITDTVYTREAIIQTVTRIIGPIAKPDKIQFVPGLPKTRSGKIMRRILRKIAEGETSNLGDTSTLLDPDVVEHIKRGAENI
jgi:acetyl-CoA synthetase